MDPQYQPQSIESSAQAFWNEKASFKAIEDPSKPKYYCLAMFPYPSGKLHMGHVRNYTITDVISRYQLMLGKNVLHPMGWDAFGLPAENAAIQNNTAPAAWTYANIEHMKQQLKLLGFGFDWSRELATCQADYYKWEQWFFTRLYEKGLVYKKMATVNWDPVDQTVLANEQVIDGRGWRSGALVERKEIPQWFIKITDYASELLDGLNQLPEWPEQVKTMQRNWIGKSRGATIRFALTAKSQQQLEPDNSAALDVYTTRPDTLLGASYVSIAAEHPISLKLAEQSEQIAAFIAECKAQSVAEADMATMEKKGIDTGLRVTHPLTGNELPIWIANYVLMDYGSGAVMAVPAHDERDFAFATQYELPIEQVIASTIDKETFDASQWQAWYARKSDTQLVNSGEHNGLDFKAAFSAICKALQEKGAGEVTTNYRLRDWGVSRQRYWGAPIPMFTLPEGGEIPVPLDRLPVLLPEDVVMDGVQSPIKADPAWRQATFDGKAVEHETDTFDTFMESSWYYARFTCPDYQNGMLDSERANYWLPVDQYVGGIEHAILHLLYARFYHKLMRDEGLLSCDEPFKQLLCQGMVLAESYYRDNTDGSKTWFNPTEVDVERNDKGAIIKATLRESGEAVEIGGMTKMSKSKNNGIDPQSAIEQFGADTVRLFTMFAAPPEQTLEWNNDGVAGAQRFLKRLWQFASDNKETISTGIQSLNSSGHLSDTENLSSAAKDVRRDIYSALKKALDDFSKSQFNTVVAACMTVLNRTSDYDKGEPACVAEAFGILLRLLSPIAPHVTHELWRSLAFGDDILTAQWPTVDDSALKRSHIDMVIQVNGKVRAKLPMPIDADKSLVEAEAKACDNVQRFIDGKTVRKVIVVPNKLVNIVVA
ncbi:leucine--tRNA ligase [bacterium]|nr:leucine--tRNA ligase [bacterium]